MAMTLDELKAQNRAAEEAEAKAQADSVVDNEPDLAQAPADDTDNVADADKPDAEEGTEAWLADSEDEQASGSGGKSPKFTSSDMRNLRVKLTSKLDKKDEELERIKAELEALKRGSTQPVAQSVAKVPTLEQYNYDEAEYAAAMTVWVRSQVQGATQASEVQTKQLQKQQELERNVNDHYERAAQLVKKHNIDPDLYHDAGLNLRKTIEAAFPGQGDVITDQMLARLGEGSEKVEYHLGRNAQKREILKAKLLDDPTGLSASIYLGKVLAEVSAPARKQTRAPAPAARATGGEGVVSDELSMKKKYQAEQDTQKRFNIRRKAKLAGIDVRDW